MAYRSYPLIFAFLALTGCQNPPPDSANSAQPTPELPLTRFRNDSFAYAIASGYREPAQLVIRDAQAWAEAWRTLQAGLEPSTPPPAIDFDQEMVVLAAMGSRNTGGYDVMLEAATVENGEVILSVRETSPGPFCLNTQALTQPVDIARVPRQEGTVRFAVRNTVRDCR